MTDIEELVKRAREIFQRRRYGPGDDYDPDFDVLEPLADALSSLQGDNEVLRLQLAAKRSTFVDAEVSSLQEELGRVKECLAEAVELHLIDAGCFVPTRRGSAWLKAAREALSSTPQPSGLTQSGGTDGVDAAQPRAGAAIACGDEVTALREFARDIIADYCWGYSREPDGGDVQELAEKLGLIVPHIATKEDAEDHCEIEPGDMIYKFAEWLAPSSTGASPSDKGEA